MKKNTFSKEERLCSRSLMDGLFRNGSSFVLYPFRVVFLPIDGTLPTGVQVLVSVSKRKFRRAYKRNRIKRKIREAYRLQKATVLYPYVQERSLNLLMAIQYIANEDLDFDQYLHSMSKVFSKVMHEVV